MHQTHNEARLVPQLLYDRLGDVYAIVAAMDDFIDRPMDNMILVRGLLQPTKVGRSNQ